METLNKLLGIIDNVFVDIFINVFFRMMTFFVEKLRKCLNELSYVLRNLSEWFEGIDDLSDRFSGSV